MTTACQMQRISQTRWCGRHANFTYREPSSQTSLGYGPCLESVAGLLFAVRICGLLCTGNLRPSWMAGDQVPYAKGVRGFLSRSGKTRRFAMPRVAVERRESLIGRRGNLLLVLLECQLTLRRRKGATGAEMPNRRIGSDRRTL